MISAFMSRAVHIVSFPYLAPFQTCTLQLTPHRFLASRTMPRARGRSPSREGQWRFYLKIATALATFQQDPRRGEDTPDALALYREAEGLITQWQPLVAAELCRSGVTASEAQTQRRASGAHEPPAVVRTGQDPHARPGLAQQLVRKLIGVFYDWRREGEEESVARTPPPAWQLQVLRELHDAMGVFAARAAAEIRRLEELFGKRDGSAKGLSVGRSARVSRRVTFAEGPGVINEKGHWRSGGVESGGGGAVTVTGSLSTLQSQGARLGKKPSIYDHHHGRADARAPSSVSRLVEQGDRGPGRCVSQTPRSQAASRAPNHASSPVEGAPTRTYSELPVRHAPLSSSASPGCKGHGKGEATPTAIMAKSPLQSVPNIASDTIPLRTSPQRQVSLVSADDVYSMAGSMHSGDSGTLAEGADQVSTIRLPREASAIENISCNPRQGSTGPELVRSVARVPAPGRFGIDDRDGETTGMETRSQCASIDIVPHTVGRRRRAPADAINAVRHCTGAALEEEPCSRPFPKEMSGTDLETDKESLRPSVERGPRRSHPGLSLQWTHLFDVDPIIAARQPLEMSETPLRTNARRESRSAASTRAAGPAPSRVDRTNAEQSLASRTPQHHANSRDEDRTASSVVGPQGKQGNARSKNANRSKELDLFSDASSVDWAGRAHDSLRSRG